MPVTVRKKGNKYAIVEKKTGKVVGYSKTKKNAKASARVRNAVKHGWKPKRK
jgi:hypothetical protein